MSELDQALAAGADVIMLDDFSLEDMRAAVVRNRAQPRPAELEGSGGVSLERLAAIAATGVDCISIGGLTKHVHADRPVDALRRRHHGSLLVRTPTALRARAAAAASAACAC